MIRQMLRKVVVLESNDTGLSVGKQISLIKITEKNNEVLLDGGIPAKFGPTLLGISKSSVETDSFLSAASFQETTKVLTEASIKGKEDTLLGLKENVIIGKLIPAGTGSKAERESTTLINEMAAEMKRKKLERYQQDNEQSEKDELSSIISSVVSKEEALMSEVIEDIEEDIEE